MSSIGCSWSGGKDSCFALMIELERKKEVRVLLNMMNENGEISRSHGLPYSILDAQAQAMNVSLMAIPTSWQDYRMHFISSLRTIKQEFEVEGIVFGDIDLQAHRDWEEEVCTEVGVSAFLPLWKQDRKDLVLRMLNNGIVAVIVSCNEILGEEFLGRILTKDLLPELECLGVDVCGENGEFHTVVIDCPLFHRPINLPAYSKVLHDSYWFLQWDIPGIRYGNQ